jgi:hypothetical protein
MDLSIQLTPCLDNPKRISRGDDDYSRKLNLTWEQVEHHWHMYWQMMCCELGRRKRLPSSVWTAIKCLPLPSTDVRKNAINFQLNRECGTGLYDVGVPDKKRHSKGNKKMWVWVGSCFLFPTQEGHVCNFRKYHIKLKNKKEAEFTSYTTKRSGDFRKCSNPAVTKGVGW